jgi:hypothetical protein
MALLPPRCYCAFSELLLHCCCAAAPKWHCCRRTATALPLC